MVLLVTVVTRLQLAPRERRDELRSAAWGLAAVPGLLSVGFIFGVLTGSGTIHLFLPLLAPQVPLSIGYSLFRHNILETRAVLTRRILWIPIASTAGAGAILVWLGCDVLLRQFDLRVYIPWASSLAAFAALALLGYRFTNRLFFSVRAEFRPIIQRLSDDLTSNRDAGAIAQALEAAVLRWLPTREARILHTDDLHRIPDCPPGHRERLSAGEAVWTTESPRRRHLLLPMRSRGELRAVLQLAPKHHAELYTQEDLALLEIVASLGAVALHNAHVIAELETFRRVEVDAARDEKRFALGLLGAEITHEIAYPLNFLRYLLGQGSAGRTLDASDVEIGQEEIGRLERMFSTLSKLRIPMPRLQPVLVLPRARRACDLIRETLIAKEIDVVVDVPSDLTVVAEPDPLVQIFANLLRNAAQAVDRGRLDRHRRAPRRQPHRDRGLGFGTGRAGRAAEPDLQSVRHQQGGEHGSGAGGHRASGAQLWLEHRRQPARRPHGLSRRRSRRQPRARCATRGRREDPGRRRPGERAALPGQHRRAHRGRRGARGRQPGDRRAPSSPPSASTSRSSTCACPATRAIATV